MNSQSSCITILSSYPKALATKDTLTINLKSHQIVILEKNLESHSSISTNINNYLKQIGVPEDIMMGYLNLLNNGSFLLIISGTYQEVELAYQNLDKNGHASSIHFNQIK